jgi:hypothetical protein
VYESKPDLYVGTRQSGFQVALETFGFHTRISQIVRCNQGPESGQARVYYLLILLIRHETLALSEYRLNRFTNHFGMPFEIQKTASMV